MSEEAKEIKRPIPIGDKGVTPQTFEDIQRMAIMIAAAGWAPASYREDYTEEDKKAFVKKSSKPFNANKIAAGIMHGLEVGFSPIASLQSIALLNGMPTIWGDGALALVQNSGLLENYSEELVKDDKGNPSYARVIAKRRGFDTPLTVEFGLSEAGKAGLLVKEGPWILYPGRMMTMRARAWVLRGLFADVLRGLHIREEIEDIAHEDPPKVEEPKRMSDAKSSTMVVGSIGANPPLSTVKADPEPQPAEPEHKPFPDPEPVDQPAQASLPVDDKPAAASATDTLTQKHRRIIAAMANGSGVELSAVEAKFGKLTEVPDAQFETIRAALKNWGE